MIPRTWDVFVGYERIVGNAGHINTFMFYIVFTWMWCSVILSSNRSVTSEYTNSSNAEYFFVFLSGPASESAESFRTMIVPILSQHFFILCKKLASHILAGVDVAQDLGARDLRQRASQCKILNTIPILLIDLSLPKMQVCSLL